MPSIALCGLAASLGFSAAHRRASSTWRTFMSDGLRVAYPVYAFAVLGTAFVLGPLFTNEARATYFRDGRLFAYLLNLLGWPQYELPGVFEFNDLPRMVNAVMWVAPLYLALLVTASVTSRRRWSVIIAAGLAIITALAALIAQVLDLNTAVNEQVSFLVQGDGIGTILGGLLGMTIYHVRERVSVKPRYPVVAVVALAAIVVAGHPGWLSSAFFRIAIALLVPYLASFLMVCRLPLTLLFRRVEPYLAGVFLLSFPLQQAMIDRGPEHQGVLVNAIAAGGAALVLAAAYWHAIGRWLVSRRVRSSHADDQATSGSVLRGIGRIRRIRRTTAIKNVAITVVMGCLFIGMMALIYIASLPDTGT
ncbi:hypothetical protein [Sphingomonas bacterium]|uniref:hypothetical protein n=1 Tax=Sphingomonas bacterium TaxID=1895847 RepID=UPI0015770C1E|nr:hypothetical protein [Sphingomonas bacterium]